MARKALTEKHFEEAEKLLRSALVYPENHAAKACFERATVGTDEPAGAMYYNDQPADMILYQGLAYLKLGKVREAKSRFPAGFPDL